VQAFKNGFIDYSMNILKMRSMIKFAFYSLLMTLAFWTCQNNADQKGSTFIKVLKEKQLGDTKFYISLPDKYLIKETRGEDFSVFYFNPGDSSLSDTFSGGIYFGNYPSEFRPENDSCKIEKVNGKILNSKDDWVLYICDNNYSIQTIIKNPKNNGWDNFIHVFGRGGSRSEINKLLDIFSTLKRK
jgi:hypothetical protein